MEGEHPAQEPVPVDRSLLPSEPIRKDVPPAKRRKTVSSQAFTSQSRGSPQPVQSRVVPRRPARKGKAAQATAGKGKAGNGKDVDRGQSLIDDAGVQGNQRVPRKYKDVNTEVADTASCDEDSADSSDGWEPLTNTQEGVKNEGDHADDVESETGANNKSLAKSVSRKGKQIDRFIRLMLKLS